MVILSLAEDSTLLVHFYLVELDECITTEELFLVFKRSNNSLICSAVGHGPCLSNDATLVVVEEVVHQDLGLGRDDMYATLTLRNLTSFDL